MIKFKTLCLKSFFEYWIKPFAHNQDIFEGRMNYTHACIDGEDMVFFAHYEDLVIGMLVIHQDEHFDDVWHNLFVSVDKKWQGQGIAKKLLENQFKFISTNGGFLINSKYSNQGHEYLKKYNEIFTKQYNVNFKEQNQ